MASFGSEIFGGRLTESLLSAIDAKINLIPDFKKKLNSYIYLKDINGGTVIFIILHAECEITTVGF